MAHSITADIRALLEREGGSLEQLEKAAAEEARRYVAPRPVNVNIGGGDPWVPAPAA